MENGVGVERWSSFCRRDVYWLPGLRFGVQGRPLAGCLRDILVVPPVALMGHSCWAWGLSRHRVPATGGVVSCVAMVSVGGSISTASGITNGGSHTERKLRGGLLWLSAVWLEFLELFDFRGFRVLLRG